MSDVNAAKAITDFVMKHCRDNIQIKHRLYNMLLELMSNTFSHAYDDERASLFDRLWYCYAEYSNDGIVKISFFDLGVGIQETIKKRLFENIVRKEDFEYILSALNGENRSETGEKNRGCGLPSIVSNFREGVFSRMKIIAGRGSVEITQHSETGTKLPVPLNGSLFYWEIDLKER